MSYFEDWNAWIAGHQAVVVAVGLPILTALASGIVAFITTKANLKSQERDRALQRQIRRFDDKKARIDQLRSAVLRYESINFRLDADFHHGFSSGIVGQIPKIRVRETLEQTFSTMTEIILLVDPMDPDARTLELSLHHQLLEVSNKDKELTKDEIEKRFFPICKRIIERMEADANRFLVS